MNSFRHKKINTKSGALKTPFFMPDATRGFVKFLNNDDIKKTGIVPMVVNTYHLFLHPGMEIIKKAGGVHKFMNYHKPLLSDSGGYQVFSLIHKNPKMGKITDNEVIFRSPTSGEKHIITPEKSIQIQFDLGVDMMVCFDDPPPNNYSKEKISAAVERTIRWAKRCLIEYNKQIKKRKLDEKSRPLIFAVVQGGEHVDLRKRCVDGLIEVSKEIGRDWDGYGFGARHVDENGIFLEEILRATASFIPEKALRFALGVGTPEDIVRCYPMGWDMFDCVIPTREGRHGRLFIRNEQSKFPTCLPAGRFPMTNTKSISNGKKNTKNKFYKIISIRNSKFKKDFSAVDKNCDCELCQNHTRAYLNHLFKSGDPLGMRLASIHNLRFYAKLMKELQEL
ncbi:MAG: tRNA guanosine(34) transglycosylase Tgt [Candidatus Moranbacteria bacterium]|jgi:queuine tRNA-ribosyltransferase|nr:tRNA guanosine(34) transglycosylase Tgt [Candidatus Moranbacteria bacterium]